MISFMCQDLPRFTRAVSRIDYIPFNPFRSTTDAIHNIIGQVAPGGNRRGHERRGQGGALHPEAGGRTTLTAEASTPLPWKNTGGRNLPFPACLWHGLPVC